MAFPEFTVLPNNFLAEEYLDFDRLASSKFRYENTYKYTANAIQLFEAFPEEICSDVDKQMEHIVENGATSVYQQNYNNTSEIDIATKIPYFPQKMVNKQLSVESITTTASKQRASPTRWLKRMVSSKSNCQMDDESNSLNAQILVDEAAERNRQLEQEARELKGKQAQELAVKNETYNNLDNHYFLNSLRNVNRKFYVYCMLNDESMQQEFDNLKKNNQRSSTNGDNSKYSVSAKVFHRYTVSLFEMNNINCKPFLMEDSAYDLPKSELGADSGNNGCKNDDPSSYCSISSLSMSPITFVDLFNESRLTTVQATLEVIFTIQS